MAKRKTTTAPSKKPQYKITHPLIGETLHFDSWEELCEHVMDVAEKEAERRLIDTLCDMIGQISDEMIEHAEEYEPELPF